MRLKKMFKLTIHQRIKLTGILFLLPSMVLFLSFHLYPILDTIRLSFFKYDLLSPRRFIGMDNYRELFGDAVFWDTVGVTLVHLLGTYIPVFIISLCLALALKSLIRFQGFFRSVFYLPNIISIISIAMVWKLIFHPSGLSAAVTRLFTSEPLAWLHHPGTSQTAIIITNIWREFGYFTVMFLAGLLGIPQEFYEAARVDGADSVQGFFYITIPLLRRTMLFVSVLCIVRGIQTFVPQYTMTRGGPGISNTPITLYIYNNAFRYFKMGKASAIAVLLGVVVMLLTFLQLKIFGDEQED